MFERAQVRFEEREKPKSFLVLERFCHRSFFGGSFAQNLDAKEATIIVFGQNLLEEFFPGNVMLGTTEMVFFQLLFFLALIRAEKRERVEYVKLKAIGNGEEAKQSMAKGHKKKRANFWLFVFIFALVLGIFLSIANSYNDQVDLSYSVVMPIAVTALPLVIVAVVGIALIFGSGPGRRRRRAKTETAATANKQKLTEIQKNQSVNQDASCELEPGPRDETNFG